MGRIKDRSLEQGEGEGKIQDHLRDESPRGIHMGVSVGYSVPSLAFRVS